MTDIISVQSADQTMAVISSVQYADKTKTVIHSLYNLMIKQKL